MQKTEGQDQLQGGHSNIRGQMSEARPLEPGLLVRSLPEEAHIPDGLILKLWSKQRVQLSEDSDEPEQIAADSSGYQHGDNHTAVGAFGHEPGPSDANDAPECREDDDREREGMSCHGESRGARPRLG